MKKSLFILLATCAFGLGSTVHSNIWAQKAATIQNANQFNISTTELFGTHAPAMQTLLKGKSEAQKELRQFVKTMLRHRLNSDKMTATFDQEAKTIVITNNTSHTNAEVKQHLIEQGSLFAQRLLTLQQSGMDSRTMMNQLKVEFSK
ncbi:MAG: hypothetical protein IPL33_06960 [Sphingobacteriales bacterium]|nr:hypothetical protein [Sphingobacteriales bacterium]MCC7224708.1 hypothetical protein [Chitinophagales bacterium]